MIHDTMIPGITYFHDHANFIFRSQDPLEIFSSAMINGDRTKTETVVNHYVDKDITLEQYPSELIQLQKMYNLSASTVVFFTAVKMNKAVYVEMKLGEIPCVLMVTAGITNSAGQFDPPNDLYSLQSDLNECSFPTTFPKVGTINTILIIDAKINPQIFGNLFIILTEAKCALFEKYNLRTRHGTFATGTTSDAIGIASTNRGPTIHWSGYATEFGYRIVNKYIEALETALKNGGYI